MARSADETEDNGEYTGLKSCPTLVAGEETLQDIASRLDSAQFDRELTLLSVIADDTRYRILRLLHEGGERCVCEFDAVLDGAIVLSATPSRGWSRQVSKLGDVKVIIAEKEFEDDDNPVKYLVTNKIDASSAHVIRSYGYRWRIETFFEDSKQDLGLADCEAQRSTSARRHW